MDTYIAKLTAGEPLTRKESYTLFSRFPELSSEAQAQILHLWATKKETYSEILGARDYFITLSDRFSYSEPVMDVVGTGGDGKGTFNISTATSLVVASCGVPVAKHGGRSSTSLSGSADVMRCLGIDPSLGALEATEHLQEYNYAYLWAPVFNQGLKTYGPLRKSLGFPTIFNILGPLLNPLEPKRLLMGVYRKDLVKTVAQVLLTMGVEEALVVHSQDGLDEISLSAPTHMAQLKDGHSQYSTFSPEDLGFSCCSLEAVKGKGPEENAQTIQDIFAGTLKGPKRDIVVINSGAALMIAGAVTDMNEGIQRAQNAIDAGDCLTFLNCLRERK